MGFMLLQKIYTNVRSSKGGIGISINKYRVIGLICCLLLFHSSLFNFLNDWTDFVDELFIIVPFFFIQLLE
jgi:hypothetical protein